MSSPLDKFTVTTDGMMICPDWWHGRDGSFRTAEHDFMLASSMAFGFDEYAKRIHKWVIPLNPMNLDEIFAKLPQVDDLHPVVNAILSRFFELEHRRRALTEATSFKDDEGLVGEAFTYTKFSPRKR